MQIFKLITGHIIFLGSCLALIIALIQFISAKDSNSKIYISCLFLILSALLFEHYYVNNIDADLSISLFPLKTFILLEIRYFKYLIGPLYFLYNKTLLYKNVKSKNNILHFLPFIILSIAFSSACFIILFIDNSLESFFRPYYFLFENVSFVHTSIYMILIIKYLGFTKMKAMRKKRILKKIVIAITTFIIVSQLLLIVSIFLYTYFLATLSVSLISLLMVVFLISSKKYPNITSWLSIEEKRIRYERSIIKGLDIQLLESRLNDLMEHEKLYRDESFNLEKCAGELHISPHQLSEFINKHLKVSFTTLINEFRLKEAKDLLLGENHFSILSIAYTVGFNSKSSFYEVFKRETGLSPSDFKKKNCPGL
jgi:AraC-like DNA-binding protein